MDQIVLLQTGPESFQALLGDGHRIPVTLRHTTRRGLGVHGVPPVAVATEIVRFLLEHDDLPVDSETPVELGSAAGRHPAFVDELRSRLS